MTPLEALLIGYAETFKAFKNIERKENGMSTYAEEMEDTNLEINTLPIVGKTLTAVNVNRTNDEIVFISASGEIWKMYHIQDCCESVDIESIEGELADIIGSPVLRAEEVIKDSHNSCESGTWTFYKISTIKGSVTIRWLGESNGYYSESVYFVELKEV